MKHNPLMLLALLFAITFASCSNSEELVTPSSNSEKSEISNLSTKSIENDILNLINDYRNSNGLPKINPLSLIKTQTHEHTNYMVSNSSVSHDNFHKRKSYLQANANAVIVGENVAYGYTSAKSVVNAWIKSDGHRKNIEGDFNYFEISAEKDSNGKWYYTNIFIKK